MQYVLVATFQDSVLAVDSVGGAACLVIDCIVLISSLYLGLLLCLCYVFELCLCSNFVIMCGIPYGCIGEDIAEDVEGKVYCMIFIMWDQADLVHHC